MKGLVGVGGVDEGEQGADTEQQKDGRGGIAKSGERKNILASSRRAPVPHIRFRPLAPLRGVHTCAVRRYQRINQAASQLRTPACEMRHAATVDL